MLGLLKRHEVQVLLNAGHKRTEVSRLTGISRSSVQRIWSPLLLGQEEHPGNEQDDGSTACPISQLLDHLPLVGCSLMAHFPRSSNACQTIAVQIGGLSMGRFRGCRRG
jgi:hypothetical protein